MKGLLTLCILLSALQAYAYDVEIENDTDATTIKVEIIYQGKRKKDTFKLKSDEERKIKRIPEQFPVEHIKIKAIKGPAKGQEAEYIPEYQSKSLDIEVELDDANQITIKKEWF